jgi:hypothetical protein
VPGLRADDGRVRRAPVLAAARRPPGEQAAAAAARAGAAPVTGDRAAAIAESFARRAAFELAHQDVTIMLPPRPTDRWRAVVPLDRAPEGSGGTLGADDLEELMDQLEEIWPPGGEP